LCESPVKKAETAIEKNIQSRWYTVYSINKTYHELLFNTVIIRKGRYSLVNIEHGRSIKKSI
jgi:hypothetical protein